MTPDDEARHCREVAAAYCGWADGERRALTELIARERAAARAECEERVHELAQALSDVLHAAGVINTVPASAAELLMVAKDYASRSGGGSNG